MTPLRRQPATVRAALAATVAAGVPAVLHACPVCFQVEQSPVTDGLRAALLVLLGVTLSVLTGFVWFIWRGTGLFSTDLAASVPGLGNADDSRPGTEAAKSVENRPVPL